MIRLLLCLALLSPNIFAEEEKSSFGAKQQRQVYQWLCSTDADSRRKAHQFLGQLSTDEEALHKRVLEQAHKHHAAPLEDTLERVYQDLQPFAEARRHWNYECAQALKLGRKNLDYDSSDLKKLDQLLKKASRRYRELQTQAKSASNARKALEQRGKILLELDIELAMLAGEDEDAFDLSLVDVYEALPFGDNVIDLVDQAEAIIEQQRQFVRIEAYNNKQAKWPTSPQRDFAKIINQMRVELGLSPLFLQKELSQGSINHSAEMAKLGYFAHESPTPANASPAKRAKNANYKGSWRGENIYKGSSSAMAAYVAWWKSDGHRKIMLMEGPNHLGIGLVKAHWTLSMGKGNAPDK